MHLLLSHLSSILPSAIVMIREDEDIVNLAIDSRDIYTASHTLFFSFEGSRVSATQYIPELIEKGVKNFILPKKYFLQFEHNLQANFIFVDSVLEALQEIVIAQKKQYNIPIVGITGSNGKTIVKEWLYQLLNHQYNIVKTPKSYNSQIGVPLSLWGIKKENTLGIFEAGISQVGEMVKLERLISPDIGIFTFLGDAHQLGFESIEGKLNEKLKLFYNSEKLVVKESIIRKYAKNFEKLKSINPKIEFIIWGDKEGDVQFYYNQIQNVLDVIYLDKKYQIQITNKEELFIENLKICIATIACMGVDLVQFKTVTLSPVKMRMEIVDGILDTTLINDTYNADIDSLNYGLNYLFKQSYLLPKSLILSEIESGIETSETLINAVNTIVSPLPLTQLIFIGTSYVENKKNIQLVHKSTLVSYYNTPIEFLEKHDHYSLKNNLILIKGSRRSKLEQVVTYYRSKTHSTYLKVELNAIQHNFKVFQSQLEPTTKIMVMLKAYGYGLGSIELARCMEKLKADYIAVAFVDEAIDLRKAGVTIPIMVINPQLNAIDRILDYSIEPEIYSLSLLQQLIKSLKSTSFFSKSKIKIHLKLETGMNRLGISSEDLEEVVELIKENNSIEVSTIFSHLASSDNIEDDRFTQKQYEQYVQKATYLEEELGYKVIKHIDNTSGILRHKNTHLNMVRLGIGLFGIDSASIVQHQLYNTFSLYSTISQIKKVKKGESIGYTQETILKRDSSIAILNIGYADGYSRLLGDGNAKVFVKNQYATTIGKISMDLTIVDITDCQNIMEGDEVEMIGGHITIQSLAKKLNTIPYEVLTSISSRVPRVYIEE